MAGWKRFRSRGGEAPRRPLHPAMNGSRRPRAGGQPAVAAARTLALHGAALAAADLQPLGDPGGQEGAHIAAHHADLLHQA